MRVNLGPTLDFVLQWEGGFSNHPDDAGGRTFAGISEAAHPDVWADGVVTADEVRDTYRNEYWNRINGDDLPSPLDMVLMDYAVHSGPGRAVREMQDLLDVTRDGDVGPRTLAVIRRHSPDLLARALLGRRALRLHRIADRRPSQQVFLNGWLRRVSALEERLG